jgi:hypothetical protein
MIGWKVLPYNCRIAIFGAFITPKPTVFLGKLGQKSNGSWIIISSNAF